MSTELTGICCQHSFDKSAAICSRCGWEFCEHCIVVPRGHAVCKDCAMLTGGIRHVASHKAMSRRRVKDRIKAHKILRASWGEPEGNELILRDPLLEDHDPLGPPTGEDLDRAGMSIDGGDSATASSHFENAEPAMAPSVTEPEPVDTTAPIDWSNPFG